MIWPFNKFATWAEEKAVKDAMSADEKLDMAR